MTTSKIIFPIVLTLQTIYCWISFYNAQFLPYDDNYGLVISSFLISLFALFVLILFWFIKRPVIIKNKLPILIWIAIGSPLTFIIVTFFYTDIFKASLAGLKSF